MKVILTIISLSVIMLIMSGVYLFIDLRYSYKHERSKREH